MSDFEGSAEPFVVPDLRLEARQRDAPLPDGLVAAEFPMFSKNPIRVLLGPADADGVITVTRAALAGCNEALYPAGA